MRVAIASDHAGFEQKQLLAAYLAEDLAQDVLDLGPDSDDRVDYPDFANKVAHAVANGVRCACMRYGYRYGSHGG